MVENGVINFATMRSTGTSNKTLTDTQIRDSIRLQLTSSGLDVMGLFKAQSAKINGLLCAKEIRVALSGAPCWPDYVLAKDYKLPTLSEVEQFIAENQHLPNVPSAAEVEADGINLGEMNVILLQKIEELTLYIIQMEKRLSELESKKGGE